MLIKIKKYEIDQGESVLATGNESVKLMTIHKSKGLEFPVVILAGTGKQINQMDMKKKVVVNNELGLGVDYIDSSTNIRINERDSTKKWQFDYLYYA